MYILPTQRLRPVLKAKATLLTESLNKVEEVSEEKKTLIGGTKTIRDQIRTSAEFKHWEYQNGKILACVFIMKSGKFGSIAPSEYQRYELSLEGPVYPLTLQQALYLGESVCEYEWCREYNYLAVFYGNAEDVKILQSAPAGLFAGEDLRTTTKSKEGMSVADFVATTA